MRIILTLLVTISFLLSTAIFAQDADKKTDLEKKIEEYQKKLIELKQQKNTLAAQISFMDTQIYLTQLKISSTEEKIVETENEINLLDEKIEGLDESLNKLSQILIERIVDGYKTQSVTMLNIFLDSDNMGDFLNRAKYQKTTQDNNQKLLIQVQESKLNFEEQKNLRERKREELNTLKVSLDSQKASLSNQKVSKQKLLVETNNDEKTYQALLDKSRAEYAAIQGIIAGAGTETKLRDVKKGDTIATVIPGVSCNSGGSHLHFIVKENGSVSNPFNYLKSVDHRNCSGSSCDSGDGDSFNPSGSWDWPLNPPITLSQGYGVTWAVANSWVGRIYSFHNGIDIAGSSYEVKAVEDGTLYRGTYNVGCPLSYAYLKHSGSNKETLYLHVYVQ